MRTLKSFKCLAVLAGLLAFNGVVYATECDLTTVGSDCTINGALFFQTDPQATGTGVFPAFVEIGANTETIEGYNTTVNFVLDNGQDDPHNHELRLSDLQVVNIDGTDYFEFVLDINQTGNVGEAQNMLTLDEIQVYQSNTPNQSTTNISSLGVLVYQLDGGGDSVILLDNKTTASGSGDGDMFFYVPMSVFSGAYEYVYLYSHFGGDEFGGDRFVNNDGFEEWAYHKGTNPIPEPATLVLLGTGLLGVAGKVRRRMKKS